MQALPLLRHQLENEQRRNEPVVGVEVVAEVIMARHLAAEDRVGLAHAALEKCVADAVHQRRAAVLGDRVLHRVARAQVVDDRRSGMLHEERFGQECGDEIAWNELARAVDEEAAVGVAVPCRAGFPRSAGWLHGSETGRRSRSTTASSGTAADRTAWARRGHPCRCRRPERR